MTAQPSCPKMGVRIETDIVPDLSSTEILVQQELCTMNTVISLSAFSILTFLWLAFGAALLFKRDLLTRIWRSFRARNNLVQLAVALPVLPVVIGLAIWETRLPVLLRLLVVIGLGWITVYTFFPQLPA